jgi:RNA 2',3'-cyclic 3'-phosphodiesterase
VNPEPRRSESTRRLFFALWPDELMQSALAAAARTVISTCDGTAVPTRNFHFTLAFLGAVPEARIADLTPIAARVALAFQSVIAGSDADDPPVGAPRAAIRGSRPGSSSEARIAPIAITLDRIEHWRKSQILCATSAAEPSAAIALAETLKSALTANDFAPDLKLFRAHATLARKVRRVTGERDMPPVHWSFRDFHLVESRTAPTGSLYSSREIYPLDMHAR